MNDEHATVLDAEAEPIAAKPTVYMPRTPDERMPPITNRFLFVDVAAQRAKQLRRGALPRLEALRPDAETGARPEVAMRLERVATEEVEHGLIVFELPEGTSSEDAAS